MLVEFPSIFVADTKINYGYNFVAPLIVKFGYRKLVENFDVKKY